MKRSAAALWWINIALSLTKQYRYVFGNLSYKMHEVNLRKTMVALTQHTFLKKCQAWLLSPDFKYISLNIKSLLIA